MLMNYKFKIFPCHARRSDGHGSPGINSVLNARFMENATKQEYPCKTLANPCLFIYIQHNRGTTKPGVVCSSL